MWVWVLGCGCAKFTCCVQARLSLTDPAMSKGERHTAAQKVWTETYSETGGCSIWCADASSLATSLDSAQCSFRASSCADGFYFQLCELLCRERNRVIKLPHLLAQLKIEAASHELARKEYTAESKKIAAAEAAAVEEEEAAAAAAVEAPAEPEEE